MNVLLTGHCSSFFIVPWVKEIKKIDENLAFYVLGLNNPGGEIRPDENALFAEVYEKEVRGTSITENRFYVLANYIRDKGLKESVKKFIRFKQFKNDVINHFWYKKRKKWAEGILENKDVVFIHYLNLANIEFIKFVKPETKLILCFWGSDLLQDSSEKTFLGVKAALQRADFISVQNHGMQFVCCAKYGWDLLPKIRIAPYVPSYKVLEQIDEFSKVEAKNKLANLFDIPREKIWVSCGYRPLPMFRQVEIIEALKELPEQLKKNIVLVMTMNYSATNKDYIAEMLQAARNANIDYSIINRYLDDDELAGIRKAMDIFIHYPLTDAMSSTFIEHMYAGNFVVTSGSLPYGLFRKCKLDYKEIDEVDELKEIIEQALLEKNFSNEENKLKIDQMLLKYYSMNNWLKIIHE